jgi:hypothetical protein
MIRTHSLTNPGDDQGPHDEVGHEDATRKQDAGRGEVFQRQEGDAAVQETHEEDPV